MFAALDFGETELFDFGKGLAGLYVCSVNMNFINHLSKHLNYDFPNPDF